MEQRRWLRAWPVRVGALVAVTAVFSVVMHPMAFVFDTYDYMFRGFHPSAYGSHPFGFGFLLRFAAAIARSLWAGALTDLIQAWQLVCVALVVTLLLARRRLDPGATVRERLGVGLLALATVALVLPCVALFINMYVGEPTSFALMAVGVVAFARAHERDAPGWWAVFGASCLIGYHIRYQHVVVPLGAALVVVVAASRRRISIARCLRDLGVVVAVLATLPLSQTLLAQGLPTSPYDARQPEVFLRKSLQCHLRCEVHLFDTSCRTPEGRRLIQESTCPQLVHASDDALGQPYPASVGVAHTLASIEPGHLGRWIVSAPLEYLTVQQHAFEIYGYDFDHQVSFFSEAAPEVLAYYGGLFRVEEPATPSAAYAWTIGYIQKAYTGWAFHVLAGVVTLLGLVVVLTTTDAVAACLCAITIGTLLVFSYFQPQVPVRYTLHVALPAVLALWRVALPSAAQESSGGGSS